METNCWLKTPSAQLHPRGRWGHSAFSYNGELYIFGGWSWQHIIGQTGTYNPCISNDLWKLNPETFSWKELHPKGRGICSRYMKLKCCCKVGERIIFVRYVTIYTHYCKISFSGDDDPLDILDLNPSLKTLCKLAVIEYGLERSGLPHDISWELGLGRSGQSGRSSEL